MNLSSIQADQKEDLSEYSMKGRTSTATGTLTHILLFSLLQLIWVPLMQYLFMTTRFTVQEKKTGIHVLFININFIFLR